MADTFELKPTFQTPDGKTFDTKAEAMEHMRRPKVVEALGSVVEDNAELVDWMADNREAISDAFDAGKIKRVSKSERGQLEKALKAVVEAGEPKFRFIAENHEAILETFRWPTQKRLSPEDQAAAVKEELTTLADGNEEVADFVIENKDAILEAFDAGKVKREINPKAREGLARYQEEQKRLKAEREAAERGENVQVEEDGSEEPVAKTPAPKKK